MKPLFLLVGINARYHHVCLAAWALRDACDRPRAYLEAADSVPALPGDSAAARVLEFTIQDSAEKMLREIREADPAILGVSCYLWNMEAAAGLCRRVRVLMPEVFILLGGPEVSHTPEEILRSLPEADAVMAGEGETAAARLSIMLAGMTRTGKKGNNFRFRFHRRIAEESCATPIHGLFLQPACHEGKPPPGGGFHVETGFGNFPSPLTTDLLTACRDRIAYLESTRGCLSRCAYCLSSHYQHVRRKDPDRIREDIRRLVTTGARCIKFVDRTANDDPDRLGEILSYLNTLETDQTFHFEIDPGLMTDRLVELLAQSPPGRIQVEAGIQSTNPETLRAVGRRAETETALRRIRRIVSADNVHTHVSLIAGLPFETRETCLDSLSEVLKTEAHQVQLGILKLLKGSRLRREAHRYGYLSDPMPPYGVYASHWMDPADMQCLRDIAYLVERCWNEGRAVTWFSQIFRQKGAGMLVDMAYWFERQGLFAGTLSPMGFYSALAEYIDTDRTGQDRETSRACLRLDFVRKEGLAPFPELLEESDDGPDRQKNDKKWLTEVSDAWLAHYLPILSGTQPGSLSRRMELRRLRLLPVRKGSPWFTARAVESRLVIDTSARHPVTGLYPYYRLEEFLCES